jgi:hypothetical protein
MPPQPPLNYLLPTYKFVMYQIYLKSDYYTYTPISGAQRGGVSISTTARFGIYFIHIFFVRQYCFGIWRVDYI